MIEITVNRIDHLVCVCRPGLMSMRLQQKQDVSLSYLWLAFKKVGQLGKEGRRDPGAKHIYPREPPLNLFQ